MSAVRAGHPFTGHSGANTAATGGRGGDGGDACHLGGDGGRGGDAYNWLNRDTEPPGIARGGGTGGNGGDSVFVLTGVGGQYGAGGDAYATKLFRAIGGNFGWAGADGLGVPDLIPAGVGVGYLVPDLVPVGESVAECLIGVCVG